MPDKTSQSSSDHNPSNYVGRFAPSPTGPLHMGSLVAALASCLDARSSNGTWLLRMEDLDPPRESVEAADQILFALEALGLHWDGPVLYQSSRYQAYQEAIADLQHRGLIFACDCSRQQVQEHEGVYPGTCRERDLVDTPGMALRCRVSGATLSFDDNLQGRQQQNLAREVGDFVIRRKDGLFAYQLAVVVDDAFQGITHIVRGIDLMDSTVRQRYLQQLLDLSQPSYAHIPVIVNSSGQKLSKQHMAAPINVREASRLLLAALGYLHQDPDPQLKDAGADAILDWAVSHWNPAPLAGMTTLQEIEEPSPPFLPGQ